MRLREIKKKLNDILVNNQIQIKETTSFNGYGHQISEAKELFGALELLSKQPWNTNDFTPVEAIIAKHNARISKTISLDQDEFSQLSTYITQVNQQLPFFMSVVNASVKDQSPQDINIQLSSEIKTPEELGKLVSATEELAKVSNVDGEGIEFAGFDKGSDWIVLSVIGSGTYALVMSGLKLAQEYFKTKKDFYGSKEAKLSYKAALAESSSKDKKFTEAGFESFQKKRMEIQLDEGIDEIVVAIKQSNGFAENEIRTKLKKTTDCLINIIGSGNEVHISMNPPSEISETSTGQIVSIDYSFLEKSDEKDKKQLTQGDEAKGKDE